MSGMTRKIVIGGVFAVAMLAAAPAYAQATRTWVSGVGDDANPCSRTAPCKTFAGAISKTAANGEINCLDPGGFGAVTITKAITISCDLGDGRIVSAGTNGVIVNAGVSDVVTLRGLGIHGGTTGLNGIRFLAGAALVVEDSTINNFNAANGTGILFTPGGTARLEVRNTTISNNGVMGAAATGGGILIQPTGTGSANVTLSDTRLYGNGLFGLSVLTDGNTGPGISVAITNSVVADNGFGIRAVVTAGTTTIRMSVNDTTVSNNLRTGIAGTGGPVVRVSNTTITGNATGVTAIGSGAGTGVLSYGNNRVNGNIAEGSFSGTVAEQ
jgi:hypothetical protein